MQGLYCALVEDNLDPKKIGRVKLRIPAIHGSNPQNSAFTSTEELSWSYPCMPFYSAYDCGSFVIPPIGCYVWAMEVTGENPYYVYFGGVPGSGPQIPKPMNLMTSDNPQNVSMGQYYTPVGQSEIPTDLATTEYGQSGVIFKSQKGHTIKYSDQDDAEFFEIIDRSGQSIRLECHVPADENVANASRRGAIGTHDGGSIIIKSGNSRIRLDSDGIVLIGDSIKLISSQTSLEV